ncbi:SAP30-binding protein-like [Xenia sp. Carnegie-2017]|uniref:SAP30-binding protein-like n=1 Tax=Xenia sp. Carnegie-2017 TaxID=2897299 RepID=UPI001F04E374|nr:SAP30-binding protein-like [Xenia sp. Carnegie-2017]
MSRLPALGSLTSIAKEYGEKNVSDEEQLEKKASKRSFSFEDEEEEEVIEKKSKDDSVNDIVMSDEEEKSSGVVPNSDVVKKEPRQASRLVSYPGYEDEDEEGRKTSVSEIAPMDKRPEDKVNASDEKLMTKLDEQLLSGSSQPTTKTQDIQHTEEAIADADSIKSKQDDTNESPQSNLPERDKLRASMSKDLLDHLDAVQSIKVSLPPLFEGRCSNTLQEKIENLLDTKHRTGVDLKHSIQRKKNFRNPSIYEKLVSFCSINETGTNYPKHIYDPFSWTEDSFYERLSKIQKEQHEKKQKERSKVEFVHATKKSASSTTGEDTSKKRKTKWDVTSSGTAALTIPPSAVQTIASVQAVVAANNKLLAVQVKKT